LGKRMRMGWHDRMAQDLQNLRIVGLVGERNMH
jgi:hypothetical protein